jgi:hypothetical protein
MGLGAGQTGIAAITTSQIRAAKAQCPTAETNKPAIEITRRPKTIPKTIGSTIRVRNVGLASLVQSTESFFAQFILLESPFRPVTAWS